MLRFSALNPCQNHANWPIRKNSMIKSCNWYIFDFKFYFHPCCINKVTPWFAIIVVVNIIIIAFGARIIKVMLSTWFRILCFVCGLTIESVVTVDTTLVDKIRDSFVGSN